MQAARGESPRALFFNAGQLLRQADPVCPMAAEGVDRPGSGNDLAAVQDAARYEVFFSGFQWNPFRVDDQGITALRDKHVFVVVVGMGG